MENRGKKKTLGRRKIEIRKIEKRQNLQVTFTKRRQGLFLKASELCILCGAEIAILVKSPAGKVFPFAHPSLEATIGRLQSGINNLTPEKVWITGRREYDEAVKRLEAEKRAASGAATEAFWWDECCDEMELHEMETYAAALEALLRKVEWRAANMEKLRLTGPPETVTDYGVLTVLLPEEFDDQFLDNFSTADPLPLPCPFSDSSNQFEDQFLDLSSLEGLQFPF